MSHWVTHKKCKYNKTTSETDIILIWRETQRCKIIINWTDSSRAAEDIPKWRVNSVPFNRQINHTRKRDINKYKSHAHTYTPGARQINKRAGIRERFPGFHSHGSLTWFRRARRATGDIEHSRVSVCPQQRTPYRCCQGPGWTCDRYWRRTCYWRNAGI